MQNVNRWSHSALVDAAACQLDTAVLSTCLNLRRTAVKYNRMGRTGLYVSEICLGTMTFGGNQSSFWRVIGQLEQNDVDALVARSLAAGVNFIDTADVYSAGASEKLLGQALKNVGVRRQDVVVATKFYGEMGPQPNNRGASRGHIMDSVQQSLERLQTDPHRPVSNPRERSHHPDRRDAARAG